MKTFQDYQRELTVARVNRHRGAMRDAGLRPVQLWVADTRRTDFSAECKRQCLIVQEHMRRVRRKQ